MREQSYARGSTQPVFRSGSVNRKRAAKYGAAGNYTRADVKVAFERQNGRCEYCGADLSNGFHVDHWKPLSGGGSNGFENLQLLCCTCNLRKGRSDPYVYEARNRRVSTLSRLHLLKETALPEDGDPLIEFRDQHGSFSHMERLSKVLKLEAVGLVTVIRARKGSVKRAYRNPGPALH